MNNESETKSNISSNKSNVVGGKVNSTGTIGGSSENTKKLVQTALFTAIIIAMAFIPYLGYIPLGFMNATIIHVPVILGALFLGPKRGAFLGGVFGATSLIINIIRPSVTSFVFSPFYSLGDVHGNFESIIICFVPRILIGVVAYYVFRLVYKVLKHIIGGKAIAFACAGIAGSLTNTLLVMNGIYFLFGESYSSVKGIALDALYGFIITIIGSVGIPEAIVAAVLVTAIGKALSRVMKS